MTPRMTIKSLGLIAASIATMPFFAPVAEARIRCNGAYQVTDGRQTESPFCGDEYLARVASSYGMRVSGKAIRRSQSIKEDACRLVGHDNRVSNICTGLQMQDQNGNDSDGSPN